MAYTPLHTGGPRCGEPGSLIHNYRLSRTATKVGRQRARNRYGAPCYFCGHWVEPGDGCIEKSKKTGWTVFC